jgi:hypothetical protein
VTRPRSLVASVALALIVLAPAQAAVASSKAKHDTKAKPKKGAAATAASKSKCPPLPVAADPPVAIPPHSKVALFPLQGPNAAAVQRSIVSALRAKGIEVNTHIRPLFDTPEQFRETSVALNLAAYIDGDTAADGDQTSATIRVRSGITGLPVASTTFAGDKRAVSTDLAKHLWDRLGTELAHACADAAKPRKAERPPLRIEAGTPIENTPTPTD